MLTLLTWIATAAFAKPLPNPTSCPWTGPPRIDAIGADSVTIQGVEYRVGNLKHRLYFTSVLALCRAGDASSKLSSWQQAQGLVIAKSIAAGAAATNYAFRIQQAATAQERNTLIAAAAAEAASFAAQIAELEAVAKVGKETFAAALMSSVAE
jgi:hypothetical protein